MRKNYEIKVAETAEEIREALRLRNDVFVKEQKLFPQSDQDEHDEKAIFINAWSKKADRLAGTVRCYEDPEKSGIWWGGRLAVEEQFRIKGVGVYLIRAAVDEVTKQKAARFLATVQKENIRLFSKLGWVPYGEGLLMYGVPHQTMEMKLYEQAKAT